MSALTIEEVEAPPVQRRRRHVEAWIGGGFLALLLLASTVVRLGVGDPIAQHLDDALLSPSPAHLFGTDELGRDVFVRTLYATWTDVALGVSATAVSLVVGMAVGVVAGWTRGWPDALLMRLTDAMIAFPFLILDLAILAITGPGSVPGIFLALFLKGWPTYARVSRAETLVVREQGWALAARTLGFGPARVVVRHLAPNVVRPCLAIAPIDLVLNILIITTLSYLGLGIQPPAPEWGSIIAGGQTYIMTAWWISTLPGIVVVLFGVSVAFLGDALTRGEGSLLNVLGSRG